jgi:hypothetical protein
MSVTVLRTSVAGGRSYGLTAIPDGTRLPIRPTVYPTSSSMGCISFPADLQVHDRAARGDAGRWLNRIPDGLGGSRASLAERWPAYSTARNSRRSATRAGRGHRIRPIEFACSLRLARVRGKAAKVILVDLNADRLKKPPTW